VIRAVAFDLDGTLIDSTEAIVQSFFHTFDVLGETRPPRAEVVRSIGHVLEDQFALFTPTDPARCVAIYREHYARVACDLTQLLPHAREAVEALAADGFRLGFATSKRLLYSEMILRHHGVLDPFLSRVGPDEVARPKPHPDAVLESARRLEVAPAEMVFVGDTHFDVLSAREAGAPCVCVTTGYATRAELEALAPEAVYDSLLEVVAHIRARRNGARPGA